MTSLHVGMNAIPEKEMKEIIVIAMSKDSMKLLCEVPIKDKALTELDVSGKSLGTEGALVVAEYLRDNGALSSLSLKSNGLLNKESGEALAGVLKANSVLTELDISSNFEEYNSASRDGAGFAQALAVGLIDSGALSALDLSSNRIPPGGAEAGMLNATCKAKGVDLAL